ncbi:MAG TPA: hypothetical protein VLM20_08195 [Methylophilaceae bacterium]|nr:hypothetical protein [Methylophilaceae bacterium]
MNVTVKQLAEMLNLSEPRIRHYLGIKGAPSPVEVGHHIYQGRVPNKYDFDEFKAFYDERIRQSKLRMQSSWERLKLWKL